MSLRWKLQPQRWPLPPLVLKPRLRLRLAEEPPAWTPAVL
jgi:hypothetical protein